MKMSNSSLVDYIRISPNKNSPRNHKIDKITIHHMAGNLSVEACGNVFAPSSRQASSNYGIGSDGRVGMYVEEKDRSWCSNSKSNDHRAVTIEVANDGGAPEWHVSDKALAKLIDLCIDICKRNGISKLNYTGDTDGNLTRHDMFKNTNCPGPYLGGKFNYIADEVNKRLGSNSTSGSTSSNTSSSTYTGSSIVDYLKSIGQDSSFTNRKKLAQANGISNYTGTASQNTQLLNILRGSSTSSSSSSSTSYYAKYNGSSSSIVDALKSIGVDSSYNNRKKIAKANGISNYNGTASQNTQLLNLLKQGKLKK